MELWLQYTILVFTHFISDWFLQPAKWGRTKTKKFSSLLLHSIQYSILFIPIFLWLKISLLWVLFIFITHLAIDNYKFVRWWNKKIKGEPKPPAWFETVQDQILHLLVLIIILIV